MKIENQINYTLEIDKVKGHHFEYAGSAENDIAGLLISCTVLEGNIEILKDQKQKLKGEEKKNMGKYISKLSAANHAIKILAQEICDTYESYRNVINKTHN